VIWIPSLMLDYSAFTRSFTKIAAEDILSPIEAMICGASASAYPASGL
jgi:hypothetical protein